LVANVQVNNVCTEGVGDQMSNLRNALSTVSNYWKVTIIWNLNIWTCPNVQTCISMPGHPGVPALSGHLDVRNVAEPTVQLSGTWWKFKASKNRSWVLFEKWCWCTVRRRHFLFLFWLKLLCTMRRKYQNGLWILIKAFACSGRTCACQQMFCNAKFPEAPEFAWKISLFDLLSTIPPKYSQMDNTIQILGSSNGG